MTAETRLGLLGGTLDPIHLGHVETAVAAKRALQLDRVHVLPSNVPPHRPSQPVASSYHRFAMAALAVNGIAGLLASDMELRTPGTSYTADTLVRFRATTGLGVSQIFFITGADAFAEIATWHRYPEVLDLAQFIVVSRPGFPIETMRDRLPGLAARMIDADAGSGRQSPTAGSTAIFLVGASTPDVSSTDVRQRLGAHRSIDGLVPASVQRHIAQHGLYLRNTGSLAADHLHDEN